MRNRMHSALQRFFQQESASGILLILATALALAAANSPLSHFYAALLDTPMAVVIGSFSIHKPLLLWINDGLMAVFFFAVGIEIKREVLHGELSSPAKVALPIVGAIGGMAVPALIYTVVNHGDPTAMRGWAIPSATDIAFALGVLSLLGNRVPASLKIFLLTLAIADDLGAIIIIALFYTAELSTVSLAIAGAAIAVLLAMNLRGVKGISPYILVGLVLWAAVLKSGVHATLAGVVLGLIIPATGRELGSDNLGRLQSDLHGPVSFVILPLFAFANTGLSLAGLSFASLLQPVPAGIVLALFLGNQIGVFGGCFLAVKAGLVRLPTGVRWRELYGVSILCGIGFTMSLFISSLAFVQGDSHFALNDRLGILTGSLLSAVCGWCWLNWVLPRSEPSRGY
ncbi:Na+/H+ antiporter NhaA [gamma proteobacterium HdN1]|nr:Na+/H+ antiporter NhaA [gamma proteobacterium HdN1]